MSDTSAVSRPGEAVIQLMLRDIATTDPGLWGLMFAAWAAASTDGVIWRGIREAQSALATAKLKASPWTTQAVEMVSAATRARVLEAYPNWEADTARIGHVTSKAGIPDVPDALAGIAGDVAFVAVAGQALADRHVSMLTMLWNRFVADDHRVRPPAKPRGGILGRLFGS